MNDHSSKTEQCSHDTTKANLRDFRSHVLAEIMANEKKGWEEMTSTRESAAVFDRQRDNAEKMLLYVALHDYECFAPRRSMGAWEMPFTLNGSMSGCLIFSRGEISSHT